MDSQEQLLPNSYPLAKATGGLLIVAVIILVLLRRFSLSISV